MARKRKRPAFAPFAGDLCAGVARLLRRWERAQKRRDHAQVYGGDWQREQACMDALVIRIATFQSRIVESLLLMLRLAIEGDRRELVGAYLSEALHGRLIDVEARQDLAELADAVARIERSMGGGRT